MAVVKKNKIGKLLRRKLGPEFIKYRNGVGGLRVAYLEGWSAINLANRIFGHNGWSSEIKSTRVDYSDETNEKYSVGISAEIKIRLKDGSFREDVGFGSSENQRSKSAAWEKARKESVTDGLKRALRQFGNALGNCCYDKEYIANIKNVEKKPIKVLNAKSLIRTEVEQEDTAIDSESSQTFTNFSSSDH